MEVAGGVRGSGVKRELKARLLFARHMEVVVAASNLDAPKVLKAAPITVLLMVVVVGAVMRIAIVQQEVCLACVFVMEAAKGARWKIARRVLRVYLDSAHPMEVAAVANTRTAKRVLREAPCFVKLTAVAEDAHLTGAQKVQKAALHTVKAMVVGKDVHRKDARRECMGELYFVFVTVGARDVLFLNVPRVPEGAQIIVSAMVARCQFEGCPKSAQGSTDFCKAHGGGRRCSWGQLGSEFGGTCVIPCYKYARGKSGLCAAHSAQCPNKPIKESFGTDSTTNDTHSATSTQMKDISAAGDIFSYPFTVLDHGQLIPPPNIPNHNFTFGNACSINLSLPEGRVHGGSLMALLSGGTRNHMQEISGGAEPGEPYPRTHS